MLVICLLHMSMELENGIHNLRRKLQERLQALSAESAAKKKSLPEHA